MIIENEIRQKTIAYLTNSLSLDELEDWLVEKSWNMHLDSLPSAISLAGEIELTLMEYSDDAFSERELRKRMLEAISKVDQSFLLTDDSSFVERPKPITRSSRVVSLRYLHLVAV